MVDEETVGQRLRRLRLEQGLTQEMLSGPGVTAAYVSRLEHGDRQPSVRVLRLLAAKLGVALEYLESGSELGSAEAREVRLADAELRLRLEGDAQTGELTAILEEAVAAGDASATARAHTALGLAAAARGEHGPAIEHLEQVIATGRVTPMLRPDVYAALGESYAMGGDPAHAVALFDQVLDDLATVAPAELAARVRFSTYLSYALTDLGNLERAHETVEEAFRLAEESLDPSDPYTRVRLYWSLGRITHEQSKPLDALNHFRRAVSLLEATEDNYSLARAYLSCAAAMLAAGKSLPAAGRLVEKAERFLGTNPEPRYLADAHRLRSRISAGLGEHGEAERHARAALELAGGHPNQYGLATWALADALAGLGDARAGDTYVEATRVLAEHGTPREQLELLRAYAGFLRAHGREGEAFDLLEQATRFVRR